MFAIPVLIDDAGDTHTQLIALLLGVCVVLSGIIFMLAKLIGYSKTAAAQATDANQAVNNVGEGEHRLYDKITHIQDDMKHLVEAQADFTERGWRHLPEDIGDAASLTVTIRNLQNQYKAAARAQAEIRRELGEISAFLKEHDKWERTQKWVLEKDKKD